MREQAPTFILCFLQLSSQCCSWSFLQFSFFILQFSVSAVFVSAVFVSAVFVSAVFVSAVFVFYPAVFRVCSFPCPAYDSFFSNPSLSANFT